MLKGLLAAMLVGLLLSLFQTLYLLSSCKYTPLSPWMG